MTFQCYVCGIRRKCTWTWPTARIPFLKSVAVPHTFFPQQHLYPVVCRVSRNLCAPSMTSQCYVCGIRRKSTWTWQTHPSSPHPQQHLLNPLLAGFPEESISSSSRQRPHTSKLLKEYRTDSSTKFFKNR